MILKTLKHGSDIVVGITICQRRPWSYYNWRFFNIGNNHHRKLMSKRPRFWKARTLDWKEIFSNKGIKDCRNMTTQPGTMK